MAQHVIVNLSDGTSLTGRRKFSLFGFAVRDVRLLTKDGPTPIEGWVRIPRRHIICINYTDTPVRAAALEEE